MNALASYLRHLIVTGLLLAIEKLKLPIEGANAAADVIALAVVGTLSWWFVKYVAPKLKIPKGSGVALFALAASLALLTPSCVTPYGSATPGFYKEASPADPEASFGVLLERVPSTESTVEEEVIEPVIVTEK